MIIIGIGHINDFSGSGAAAPNAFIVNGDTNFVDFVPGFEP